MIKLIVFDMAGTTVNEDNVVYKTLRSAIDAAGIDVSLNEVLKLGAGKEKLQAVRDILYSRRIYNDQLAEDIHQKFLSQLGQAYQTMDVAGFDGALDLFDRLREENILIALNTGYNRPTAELLLEEMDWKAGREVDVLITASDVTRNRPYPDMIDLAMKTLNVADAEDVVKVGDSIIDIEEGKNANCGLTIGVTTGVHTFDQLTSAAPDYIVENLLQIGEVLEKVG